jgi:3-hydroxybutyryl-CoA dehydrogenase
MNELKKVGVLGAGMMGAEIALSFAMHGYDVVMKDMCIASAEKGKARLHKSIDRKINKGLFDESNKELILSSIHPTDSYHLLEDAELVVEAVFEDIAIKQEIFLKIDSICKPDTVFATNTSSLSVTKLASVLPKERICNFIGTHFFSPASVMKLVEVVPGVETSNETVAFVMDCCVKIKKTPVRVKDVPGFAVNRMLMALNMEAMRLVEEGVISAEDADKACSLGLGHPIGPFALMDLSGLDLNLTIAQIFFEAYGERFMPRPIFKQKVDAGHLGRKTGCGWLEYKK